MPSPFSGFDPYIENPRFWPAVHTALNVQFHEQLNQTLPPGFLATIEERVYLLQPDKKFTPADPSFAVTLGTEETVERYIEVRLLGDEEETVAVIELLSPTNKTSDGYGHDSYVRKQQQVLRGGAHLLEIDLLRRGLHTVAVPQAVVEHETGTGWDYLACLHRAGTGPTYQFWPVTVRSRLPRVTVPLTDDFPDVVIDLQAAFDHVYDAGQFTRRIKYKNPADPPLAGQDDVWADALLRSKGLR